MRRSTMLLLNIILLVTFVSYVHLQESNNGDTRCLILDRHGSCSCCKSGFRGKTCNDSCEHCLSRLGTEQSCTYYCKTGYYGKTCYKPCPTTCAPGISGPNFCKEKYELPICVQCIPGFYGKQCDQICDANCLNRKCYQADGKCLSCINNEFYGDHCRLPCKQGCVSGTCNRAGHCTNGCKFGFYGGLCESLCGSNCKQGKCTSHGYHAYNCTKGCHGGYWGTPCFKKCPNHCTKCEQQSGRCTLCVENYVQEPETGECVRVKVLLEGKPAVADGSNLVIIVIVVNVGIALIIIWGIIIIAWRIWRHRHRNSSDISPEELDLLSNDNDNIRLQPVNYQVNKEDFLKPRFWDKLIAALKKIQFILVLGHAGEGKTVLCQMLLDFYRSQNMSVKICNSLKDMKYMVNYTTDTILLVDDVFGKLVCELQMTPDIEQCLDSLKTKSNIKVVSTSRIDVYTDAHNYLGRFRSLFTNENTFTFSLERDDKEHMLTHHLNKSGQTSNFTEDYITDVTNIETMYGFPHSCQMYSSLQYYIPDLELLDFFKETHNILVNMFQEMLNDRVKKFVLFLLLANDGPFNMKTLESKPGRLYRDVTRYLGACSVNQLKEAMASMPKCIFNRSEDTFEFQHSSLIDLSLIAIALHDIQFVLRFGPLSCLESKVWQHSSLSSYRFSDDTDLAKRFAGEMNKETVSKICRHHLIEKENFVCHMLGFIDEQTLTILILEGDLMYWMSSNKSDALTRGILQHHQDIHVEQKLRAVLGICRFGNVKALEYLTEKWDLHKTPEIFDGLCENSIPCLIVAANQNHEGVVKRLITLGANRNICDTITGSSVLHWSAAAGHSSSIDVLLKNGCPVNSLNQGHATPLFLAAANGHLQSVKTLCESRADVSIQIRSRLISLDSRLIPGSASIKQIRYPDKDFSPLHVACYEGHINIIKVLLKQGAMLNKIITQGSPIELAAKMDHLETFSFLLEQDNINLSYAISGAFEYGRTEMIEKILSQRCREDLLSVKFAFYGHLDLLKSTFETNPDLLNKEIHGFGCLHFASIMGHHHVVDFLLKKDIEVSSISSHYEFTALHCAAIGDQCSVIRQLMETDMNINIRCKSGNTALHFAASNGNNKTVELLLENKDIDINVKGQWMQSALHCACTKNHLQVVKTLVKHRADVNALSDDFASPLAFALYEGNEQIAYYLINAGACIHPTVLAFSPLISAAASGRINMIRFLLEKGADINHTGTVGFSILHFLTWMGSFNVLLFLMKHCRGNLRLDTLAFENKQKHEKDAVFTAIRQWCKRTAGRDINLERYDLGTALHVATDLGNTDIMKLLIDNGASLKIKNKNKELPKDIADANGDKRVIAFFQ